MNAQGEFSQDREDERWRHLLLALTPSRSRPLVECDDTKQYAAFPNEIDELTVLLGYSRSVCHGLVLERKEFVLLNNALRAHADRLEKSRAEGERHSISLEAQLKEAIEQAIAERQGRERLQADADAYVASLKAQLAGHDEALRAAQAEVVSLRAAAIAERAARERLQVEADQYVASLRATIAEHAQALQAARREAEALKAALMKGNGPSTET